MEYNKDALIHLEFVGKGGLFDFLAGLSVEFYEVRVQIIRRETLASLNNAFVIIRGEGG